VWICYSNEIEYDKYNKVLKKGKVQGLEYHPSQLTPSLSRSNPCGSDPETVNLFCEMSGQDRSNPTVEKELDEQNMLETGNGNSTSIR
jgi:hypothetical protein